MALHLVTSPVPRKGLLCLQIPDLTRLTDQPQDFAEFVSAAGWAVGAVDTRLRRAGVMAKRILDYGRVAWLSIWVADNAGLETSSSRIEVCEIGMLLSGFGHVADMQQQTGFLVCSS